MSEAGETGKMISDGFRQKHLAGVLAALEEVTPISAVLIRPKPEAELLIGALVDNTIFQLNSFLVHLQEKRLGPLYLGDLNDDNFVPWMASIHRSFYSDLVLAVEGACTVIVRERIPSTPDVDRKFMECADLCLSTSVNLNLEERRRWRQLLDGLRILRNKSSHYRTILRFDEQEVLKKCGLEHHINAAGGVHSNFRNYKSLIGLALQFVREV